MKGTKPKQLMVKSRAGQSDHMQNITRMNSARKLYKPQLCWSFDKAGNKECSDKECCFFFFMYKELNMGSIQLMCVFGGGVYGAWEGVALQL